MKPAERLGKAVMTLFRKGAEMVQISRRNDEQWQIDAVDDGRDRKGIQKVDESLTRAAEGAVRDWPR